MSDGKCDSSLRSSCQNDIGVNSLLEGKDVLAVLPTGFGKSLMYQSFVLAKEMIESSIDCSSGKPSCLVIVLLCSINED